MKVRLTEEVDAFGQAWPAGTVLEAVDARELAWTVVFPAMPDVRGTVTRRQAVPVCIGCGNEIDPDTCCCGDPVADHSYGTGHGAVPMGCACGYGAGRGNLTDLL